MRTPKYFDEIRDKAEQRWNQLENDRELASAWRILFQQVQSPRHVLSELLQNADDAGATSVKTWIDNDTFIFEHNGEDFSKEHFASLCRFGYSNKRVLHTIGFRGVGFKSLFSLGDKVELYTPTLSIYFLKSRFTQPHWNPNAPPTKKTLIRVNFKDANRQAELNKSFEVWQKSPVSLLFFRSIRTIQIEDTKLKWQSKGLGPVPNSEWMTLDGQKTHYLVIRSAPKAFPKEAIQEINEERLLSSDEELSLPPCQVELILNAEGRLYVVLPTGVETELPFAINAPFVQDPARVKIKDPSTSPTNQWLLERAAQLAADTMLKWLKNKELSTEERAKAYDLMPNVDRQDSSLEGTCATMVEEGFETHIDDKPVLLTEQGTLKPKEACIVLPNEILDVWDAKTASECFDENKRPALSRHVSNKNREKFSDWQWCDTLDREGVVKHLGKWQLPKPNSWEKLLILWVYLAEWLTSYRHQNDVSSVCILPIEGKPLLYSASDVVRLNPNTLPASQQDLNFILRYLNLLSPDWLQFLESRQSKDAQAAKKILHEMELAQPSDLQTIFDQISEAFFDEEDVSLHDCVRLAQIAAKWKVKAGTNFQFFTRDGNLQSNQVLYDMEGELETLIPPKLRNSTVLHPAYTERFLSCTKEEWEEWISSGKSGLHTCIPLKTRQISFRGMDQLEQICKQRGLANRPVKECDHSQNFEIAEQGFDSEYWQYWEHLAQTGQPVWDKVVEMILRECSDDCLLSGVLKEWSKSWYHDRIMCSGLPASWVIKLRELSCLPDTNGVLRKPSELLRRTPATEVMHGVEPFLRLSLDKEEFHKKLDIFGVRTRPAQPDIFLKRLRALAKATNPPIEELEKIYKTLDKMYEYASTDEADQVKKAFQTEKLIFSESHTWESAAFIFLNANEEDVPGVPLIRTSLKSLTLWHKVGVADRPSIELAIQWLKSLDTATKLTSEDLKRVKAILTRDPVRIWNECEHWLNLEGEWKSCSELKYSLSMQSLTATKHLYASVKQQTADFQFLSAQVLAQPPFSEIPPLATMIEERVDLKQARLIGNPEPIPWLNTFGMCLFRIQLPDKAKTEHIKTIGQTLAKIKRQRVQYLISYPYIDSQPVGTHQETDIVWNADLIYIKVSLPSAKLAKRLPEEIARRINDSEITAALHYCFERNDSQIQDYFEENFDLLPLDGAEYPIFVQDATLGEQESEFQEVHQTERRDVPREVPDKPWTYDEYSFIDENTAAQSHASAAQSPPKPSLMERFALAQGFRKQGDQFYKEDGSRIEKTGREEIFRWAHYAPDGERIRSYLTLEKCLEEEPIELSHEAWTWLNDRPETHSLILVDRQGEPIERTGTELKKLAEKNRIKLYPATYRIKMES